MCNIEHRYQMSAMSGDWPITQEVRYMDIRPNGRKAYICLSEI